MHEFFNENEKEKYSKLMALVMAYEEVNSIEEKNKVYLEIIKYFPDIDRYHLDEYWTSKDVEQFCEDYSIEDEMNIDDIGQIKFIENILTLKVNDYIGGKCGYLVRKYANYFEIKYGCPSGTFFDIMHSDGINTSDDVISKLKGNGPIYL